jgi:peptide/nickel transport system permease protein
MRRFGWSILAVVVFAALFAPVLAPHGPDTKFSDLLYAPPTIPHLIDDNGGWHAPFIYRWTLADRLEQRFTQERSTRVALAWFRNGHIVESRAADAPLMLAGADGSGRDVFSRLLFGGRTSLSLALLAALGATLIGALVGGLAGYVGGTLDDALMRATDFVLVLPIIYVVLALRAFMPLVVTPATVFVMLVVIFAVVGAPFVARGVRAIVRHERRLEYADAVRSLGAGHMRLLTLHLLPASFGYIVVQLTVLVPAFIVAEATLSYVGLGFQDPIASWGAMLQEASNTRALTDFRWLLSPAAAIFLVVLALNLVLQQSGVNAVTIPSDETLRHPHTDPHTI